MSSHSENLKKTKIQPLPSPCSSTKRSSLHYNNINHSSNRSTAGQQNNEYRKGQNSEEHFTPTPHIYTTSTEQNNKSPLYTPFSILADSYLHKDILHGIKRESERSQGTTGHASADNDIVSSMATRLATVERELLSAKREIIEKDAYIRKLEEKQRIYSSNNNSDDSTQQQLIALQKQVQEMEEFLNDYGMIWVGNQVETTLSPPHPSSTMWSPGASLQQHHYSPTDFNTDFNRIVSNICSLNTIAGEDCPRITHTPTGAELKVPKPIPLALYSNGMLMFDGPFRPYTDPSTQEFIQDLTDGYFPTELKHRYPDGIPFKLTDKRYEEYCQGPQYYKLFPGTGQKLSNPSSPSSPSTLSLRQQQTTTNPHSSPVSVQNFLKHIPKNVIKSGHVIDVHAGLTETLQGSPTTVTIVDTSSVIKKNVRQKLDFEPGTEENHSSSQNNLVTLRIKSENGDTTYILKMQSSDTIGDIHRHLSSLTKSSTAKQERTSMVLKSAFPTVSYTSLEATLQECGLYPSANLYLSSTIK